MSSILFVDAFFAHNFEHFLFLVAQHLVLLLNEHLIEELALLFYVEGNFLLNDMHGDLLLVPAADLLPDFHLFIQLGLAHHIE